MEYRIELSTARDERDIKVKELHPSEQDSDNTTSSLCLSQYIRCDLQPSLSMASLCKPCIQKTYKHSNTMGLRMMRVR